MVRCDECLRANPPTRGACLYCGAALGKSPAKAEPPKPQLRPLEKWEHGFNNILTGRAAAQLSRTTMEQAAALVKLNSADLARIINSETPLPVARAANREEAELIQQNLEPLGLQTRIVSDESLGENQPQRLRTVDVFPEMLALHPTSGEPTVIAWGDLRLLVAGRLFEKQIEVKEQRRRGSEGHIVDARETTSDEAVLDLYTGERQVSWRILGYNFDFSCLGSIKSLLAGENFTQLTRSIRERATLAEFDDSYNRVRRNLEFVWPSEQQTSSLGWRRERAGKFSTSEMSLTSNEPQFTRYSRLRHFLKFHPTKNSS